MAVLFALAATPPTPAATSPPTQGSEAAVPGARVLVVADIPYIRSALDRALRNQNFVPILASDGGAALEMAGTERPDIAIVDLGLPVINGFEVIAALKQAFHTRLPVIAISSRSDLDARVQAFEAGADDFLTKPISGIELLRRLNAFRRTQLAYIETQKAHERAEHASTPPRRPPSWLTISTTGWLPAYATCSFCSRR